MTTRDMTTPLVSILIPAFNAERTIVETLESARAQSYRDLEIIVVDDGSSDGTAGLVSSVAQADPRIKLIRQPNQGVASARNTALAIARGELVAPLDADDLWHVDKIGRQVTRLHEAGPRAGFVYCWSVDIDESSHLLARRLDLDRYEGNVFAPLIVTNFLCNGSVPLIRRSLLERIGGWDPDPRTRGCKDWLLYLRLAHVADLALEPAFLVGYRKHAGSMSRDSEQMRRSHEVVLAEARRLRPDLSRRLHRWSRGAFDIYRASLLAANGRQAARAWAILRGIGRDPLWVARLSTRRKLGGLLRRMLLPGPPKPTEALMHFEAMDPDLFCEVSEGQLLERRRRDLANRQARSRPALDETRSFRGSAEVDRGAMQ